MISKINTVQLFKNIKALVEQSRKDLHARINTTTETYFHMGKLIVEFGQWGSNGAAYAKESLINLFDRLISVPGKGFWVNNLESMRKFYVIYKDPYLKHTIKNQKSGTPPRKLQLSPFNLSWSHYILPADIENSIGDGAG